METQESSSSFFQIFIIVVLAVASITGWYFNHESSQLAQQLQNENASIKNNLNNKTNQVYELLDKHQQLKDKENSELKGFQVQIDNLKQERTSVQQRLSEQQNKTQNELNSCQNDEKQSKQQLIEHSKKVSQLQTALNNSIKQQQNLEETEFKQCKDAKTQLAKQIEEKDLSQQQLQSELLMQEKSSRKKIASLSKKIKALDQQIMALRKTVNSKNVGVSKPITVSVKSNTVSVKSKTIATNNDKKVQSNSKTNVKNELNKLFDKQLNNKNATFSSIGQNGILVTINSDYLFNVGSYQITKNGADFLTVIANHLKALNQQDIEITGHTDNRPAKKQKDSFIVSNWELSAARAGAIIRLFQFRTKIQAHRMKLVAASQYQPLKAGNSEKVRQKNRRIEIKLLPK